MILLLILNLLITHPAHAAGKVFSVRELGLRAGAVPLTYDVFEKRNKKTIVYEFRTFRAGRLQRAVEITEDQFKRLQTEFLELIVEDEARSAKKRKACPRNSLEIELPGLKERLSVCEGDYRNFFRAQTILNEYVRLQPPVAATDPKSGR